MTPTATTGADQAIPGSPTQPAWRQFQVQVVRTARVSPSMVRVTFGGEDLADFADAGWDTRIKLVLPLPDSGLRHVPDGPQWYAQWRALPQQQRNPIRTYTVRAVRAEQREVDVDMLSHGDSGPATRWLQTARPGNPVVVIGPNARYTAGPWGGTEFCLDPAAAQDLLLVGDETALPAIAAIVESLPADATGQVYLEAEVQDQCYPLRPPAGVEVTWVVRTEPERPGAALVDAVQGWRPRLPLTEHDNVPEPTATDAGVIWERPSPEEDETGSDSTELPPVWAWVAGESGAVTAIRRHLVREIGLPRRRVAFMGYWKKGVVID